MGPPGISFWRKKTICIIIHQRKDIRSAPDVNTKRYMDHLKLEYEIHMKYSRCNQKRYIWNTPDVSRNDTSGLLQMSKDIFGVLQMSPGKVHLEHSRCFFCSGDNHVNKCGTTESLLAVPVRKQIIILFNDLESLI